MAVSDAFDVGPGPEADSAPLRPCAAVRSTMIIASLRALRGRGKIERYVGAVDPRARDELLALASPVWVRIELAEAHYAACDALGLSTTEMLEIGAEVSRVDAAGAHVLIGIARAGGITPWSVLSRLPAGWNRMYQGSAFRWAKAGPKEAKIVLAGNRLARFNYWRIGVRGVGEGLFRQFCSRVYIKEVAERRTLDSASYVMSWA
jgi:hypothetical protein